MADETWQRFDRAVAMFDDRVHAIRPDQWTNPTPDTEWDVRALVNHLIVEQLWVPETVGGRTVEEVGDRFEGDHAGKDPIDTWERAVAASRAAFSHPGVMEREVHLSGRDAPAAVYCSEMTCDAIVHTWDLAAAIGGETALDPDLVDFAHREFDRVKDMLASTGLFADPLPVADDADAQTKMLAIVGRRADWSTG